MSVFRGFQKLFVWTVCASLMVVVVEQCANADKTNSCAANLYRAYDNTDDSYLGYINLSDGVNFGTVTYTGGQAWPATGLTAAPTYNGYTFDGFYLREIQQYSSSMSSVINAPAQCIDGGLLAHWTLSGCNAGVDNIDYNPPVTLTSAGTTNLGSSTWEVIFGTKKIKGGWACSSIPGGYDVNYGFSTASYSAMSSGTTSGNYCWCRINYALAASGSVWEGSQSPYAFTQWVYSDAQSSTCSADCSATCANMAATSTGKGALFRETLYGQNCPFKITYNNTTGHTNTVLAPTQYTYSSAPVTLPVLVPSISGEVFVGWYESSNYSGSAVTSIQKNTTDTGNKIFYAKWGCAAGYTEEGCPLNNITGMKITNGYEFVSEDGTQFSANAADLALFNSEWEQKFAYNNNNFRVRGKSVCSVDSNVPNGMAPSSTSGKYCWCKPTLYIDENDNYHGVGTVPWYSGAGSSFPDEFSCKSGCAAKCEQGNTTFKCVKGCQPNVCFVNYYNVSNSDETWPSPKMTPALFSAETPVTSFTVSNPSRPTHAFVSWCENAGLTNCSNPMTIATNSCTTDQSTINLYAKWNQLYTLSYACDNGATPPSSTNVAPGNVLLADKDAACGGHTSCETVRWNCVDANNNNVNVVNVQGHSGLTMPAANVTCTLVRNTISYEIGVEGNGGSGELRVNGSGLLIPQDNSFQCQCGTTVTLPEWGLNNTLTQNGKVFIGWADYDTGNLISAPFNCADTKVVATWCDCVQNCTAGSNSASCSYTGVANNSCGYNYSCSTGYNNNGVTSGTYYAAAGTCPSSVTGPSCSGNEIVLQWYNQNTQLNNEPQSCIYGTPYSAATGAISTIVPPTRQGYDFTGWTVTGYQP